MKVLLICSFWSWPALCVWGFTRGGSNSHQAPPEIKDTSS